MKSQKKSMIYLYWGQCFGGLKACYFDEKAKMWICGDLKALQGPRGEYKGNNRRKGMGIKARTSVEDSASVYFRKWWSGVDGSWKPDP